MVIDPGVGTARRGLAMVALQQHFVGPDNGVFTFILQRDPEAEVYEITDDDLSLPSPSNTFHGRDIFAPVAAALASGSVRPSTVGPLITDPKRLSDTEPREESRGKWRGRILSVDRFGNLITNLKADRFMPMLTADFSVLIQNQQILKLGSTFGEMELGELFVYSGSSGYLEIGANRDHAAEKIGAGPGEAVILRP